MLADDEEDELRLREVTEVEGELNLNIPSAAILAAAPAKDDDTKLLYGGDNQKLI